MIKRLIYSVLLVLFGLLLLGPMLHSAFAHSAPSGWVYPPGCCNGADCRPEALITTDKGYLIPSVMETIPYGDSRIRESGDAETHVCRTGHSIYCIYISIGA